MEKAMTILLAAMMLLQAGSLQEALRPANGLAALREAVSESALTVDGVVLEAWTPKANERAVAELAQALNLPELSSGGQQALGTYGTVKLIRSGQAVTVQMILPEAAEAETYYQILSRWMTRYGQGRPAGATLLAHTEETLDVAGSQALVAELMGRLPAHLVSSMQQERLLSSAYQVAGVGPSLEIAGETVNVNVACVRMEKGMAVYLGSPVIFEQY